MAEVRISDLQERADIDLTDFFAVDNATSTRKLAMTTLLSHIADDYQTQTDNSLETTDKTVVGAINELNSNVTANSYEADDVIDLIVEAYQHIFYVPKDGYLTINASYSTGLGYNVVVTDSNGNRVGIFYKEPGTLYYSTTTFLKKGMGVTVDSYSEHVSIMFFPFSY
jgi:hypothetical protein